MSEEWESGPASGGHSSGFEEENTDCDEVGHSATDDGDVFLGFRQTPAPQVRNFTCIIKGPFLTDPQPSLNTSDQSRSASGEYSSGLEAEDIDCDEVEHSATDNGGVFLGFGQMPDPQVRHFASIIKERFLTDPQSSFNMSDEPRHGTGGRSPDAERGEGSRQLNGPFLRLAHGSGDHQGLQELYSTTLGMLRDSAAQFEEIQKTLSEFLERSKAVDEPRSPEQKTRPRRRQVPRRRTEIDLGLKVRSPVCLPFDDLHVW